MKERRKVFEAIFNGDERDDITANINHVRDIAYEAAQEAKLFGAALMYELLKGGGVR